MDLKRELSVRRHVGGRENNGYSEGAERPAVLASSFWAIYFRKSARRSLSLHYGFFFADGRRWMPSLSWATGGSVDSKFRWRLSKIDGREMMK
jgi:hypothetical protein